MAEALSFPQTRTFSRMCVFSFSLHACILLLVLFTGTFQQAPKKKILVRTVTLSPKAPTMPVNVEEKIAEATQSYVVPEESSPTPQKEEPVVEEHIEEPPAEESPKPVKQPAREPKKVEKSKPKEKVRTHKPEPKVVKKKVQPKKSTPQPKTEQRKPTKPQHTSEQQNQRHKAQQDAERKARVEKEKLSCISNALSNLEKANTFAKDLPKGAAGIQKGPEKISSLQAEGIVSIGSDDAVELFSPKERSYYDELVMRLKLALRLPEYGKVRIRLKVSREGKVVEVHIVSAESQKNRTYVGKMVREIHFPQFGDNFQNEKEHSFLLNLRNELSY